MGRKKRIKGSEYNKMEGNSMSTIPKKVAQRIIQQVPRFQKILQNAVDRDVNESDTVTIVTDMLSDLFGFDKYNEITSEQAIRGTYCDLAVKVDGSINYLIEVKAPGIPLKKNHLRQALNYGANEGVTWVVLTNGVQWEVHRLKFEKPISSAKVCEFNFLEISPRSEEDRDYLIILCREGLAKVAIEEFYNRQKTFNRFVVAALIETDPVLSVVRKEIRKLSPGIKISVEDVRQILPDVFKRDVQDGDEAVEAAKLVRRKLNKIQRQKAAKEKVVEPETSKEAAPEPEAP